MTDKQLLKQALEALEGMYIQGFTQDDSPINNSITALQEALVEQPAQQKPVAWQWLTTAHFRKKLPKDAECGAWNPLYTRPQPAAWDELTLAEVKEAYAQHAKYQIEDMGVSGWVEFARAIEAKLKEKNTP